jgi:hypothetical protein
MKRSRVSLTLAFLLELDDYIYASMMQKRVGALEDAETNTRENDLQHKPNTKREIRVCEIIKPYSWQCYERMSDKSYGTGTEVF